VSTPSLAALALRRRRLLALHRRHAGRVRAIFYWLGADLEVIDDAVLRCFLLAERHGLLPSDARARPWFGHLAWRIASVPARAEDLHQPPHHHDRPRDLDAPPLAPALPPAADTLARFLAVHAVEPTARAAFVLSEFSGLGTAELAVLLPAPLPALRGALRRMRQALAADHETQTLGGPRSLLAATLAPFLADPAWTRDHRAQLAAHLRGARPGLGDILRTPHSIIGLGLATIVLLLLLRPAPTTPPPSRPPPATLAIATPTPPPAPAPALPLPLPLPPVPMDMPPEPADRPRLARVRGPRKSQATRPAKEALTLREQQARTRDPGAIIIELEMIGAGRKALASNPGQALAYADQHARNYPQSQLITQRAELRVRALCALSRRDEARAEADRRGPGKVRDALKQACGL